MKRVLSIFVLDLTLPMLYSCNASGGSVQQRFEMKATVCGVGEKIEVDVFEAEYASGVFWIITSDATVYLDKDGKKITRSDINLGDTVLISYNGQVMMSYPPQVAAVLIQVL